MKIDNIDIFPYELNFKEDYKNSLIKINKRNGWIVKISSNGFSGFGDAAPLDSFSHESYNQSRYGIEGFMLALDLEEDISFEELIQLSEAHGELQPSVEFAISSALYDLASKLNCVPVRQFISPSNLDFVKVCYYENHNVRKFDNMVVKIKVMDTNLFDQVDKINRFIDQYQCDIKLRLDFNGAYDLPRAIRICKMMQDFPIDYIEQPLSKSSYEDMYELSLHTEIPIAVDEMATNINSIHKILDFDCADVFVLKPMLIGGVNKVHELVKLIKLNNKRAIISSLLESNVGRLMYLQMSSAFEIKDYNGVATNHYFQSDLCKFPSSKEGCIKLGVKGGIGVDDINL